MSAESGGKCSKGIRCSRSRIPKANKEGTRTSASTSYTIAIIEAGKDMREFPRTHEQPARSQLGIGGIIVVVIARDGGAEDKVGSSRSDLFLSEVLLASQGISCRVRRACCFRAN
jgi:hypothetical protein